MIDNVKKTEALKLHLKTGEVVICDFSGFVVPEMVKLRPVVVISKTTTHSSGLCTIVPLSTTEPVPKLDWHVLLSKNPLADALPTGHAFQTGKIVWAKCNMLYTVSFSRLTRPHRRQDGNRRYLTVKVPTDDLAAIFDGVRAYLPAQR